MKEGRGGGTSNTRWHEDEGPAATCGDSQPYVEHGRVPGHHREHTQTVGAGTEGHPECIPDDSRSLHGLCHSQLTR